MTESEKDFRDANLRVKMTKLLTSQTSKWYNENGYQTIPRAITSIYSKADDALHVDPRFLLLYPLWIFSWFFQSMDT